MQPCTVGSDQNHPQGKKKCKKSKWLSDEALQIAENVAESSTRETKHQSHRVGELRFITPAGPEELIL